MMDRDEFGSGVVLHWGHRRESLSGPLPHDALMALTDHLMAQLPEDALYGIAEPKNIHELETGRDFIFTRVAYVG